jgi:sarcosine oxidase subunit alpha
MSGHRLPGTAGALIDRATALGFEFEGRRSSGFAGDTLASALLAGGARRIARSFKLHRPRGVFSCGPEEPSAIVDVGAGADRIAVTRATDIELFDGLVAGSGHAWPAVSFDLAAINDLLSMVLPAGFYYKTFKWPDWHLFEPMIRRMAGLGVAPVGGDPDRYDETGTAVEVLVIGGGAAGIAAATAAADAGASTLLVEADPLLGGWHRWASPAVPFDAAAARAALERHGVGVMTRTSAVGVYDHGLVTAIESMPPAAGRSSMPAIRERLWKVRARHIVFATGSYERPMLFPDNDRPGVMLAGAVQRYAGDYGVACGRRVLLAVNADSGYQTARALSEAGIDVVGIVDARSPAQIGREVSASSGVPVWSQAYVTRVVGRASVSSVGVRVGSQVREVDADTIACVGGLTPNVALFSQSGGRLQWLEASAMFAPLQGPEHVLSVGACAGVFDAQDAVGHAADATAAMIRKTTLPMVPVGGAGSCLADTLEAGSHRRGKVFVDLQNDVKADDIALAAREGYRSVEHLKRYTTTGMGTDQGKTSNVNALVRLGSATGREPSAVGTTRFRPPFKPVTLGVIAGGRTGDRYRPRRALPAHSWHEARGALFEEFGTWSRPAAYPRSGEDLERAALREVVAVRSAVGIFDGSPLGKIEVIGPDAGTFLDRMYVQTLSSLALGQARYALLLDENGVIADDGIVARLGAGHFWVNITSAGAERTAAAFEEWLQCEYLSDRVAVVPVTGQWANVTVAGPFAWRLLAKVGIPEACAPAAMKHMTMLCLTVQDTPLRVLRASYSGELSYEINLPPSRAIEWLDRLWRAGESLGVVAFGVEALQTMRLEKGFLHVGADTDGTTQPADVGFGAAIARKTSDFVGRRSLSRPAGIEPRRMQLVGFRPVDRRTRLPVGAQVAMAPLPCATQGWITSSGFSPALGEPVAMGMLAGGAARIGERVSLYDMGAMLEAEVVRLPFLDPSGERLKGA